MENWFFSCLKGVLADICRLEFQGLAIENVVFNCQIKKKMLVIPSFTPGFAQIQILRKNQQQFQHYLNSTCPKRVLVKI